MPKLASATEALSKLAKLLGRSTEQAAPAVEQAASHYAIVKPNGQIFGAPFSVRAAANHIADNLNMQMPGHTVRPVPADLSALDKYTPSASAQGPQLSPEAIDDLMARSGGGQYRDPNGMAEGGSFDPISDAAERVRGSSSPGSPGVSGAIKDAVDALKSWMAGAKGEMQSGRERIEDRYVNAEDHAEGGTTGVSTEHEDSGLGHRFLTRVREQAYGLDANGQPALGGRAWTEGQGGTPMGFLDEVASVPHTLISLARTTRGLSDRGIAKHFPGYQDTSDAMFDAIDPQWSQDASGRLEQLRSAMNKQYGVKDAHSLPEHLTDAAASLISPIPALGDAKAAGAAGRLLEMTTPLRPRTLKNFATDTALMGGASAGVDALTQKLARLQAQAQPQGGGTPVDPSQFSHDMGVQPEPTGNIHNNHQMIPLVTSNGDIVMGVDPQTFASGGRSL